LKAPKWPVCPNKLKGNVLTGRPTDPQSRHWLITQTDMIRLDKPHDIGGPEALLGGDGVGWPTGRPLEARAYSTSLVVFNAVGFSFLGLSTFPLRALGLPFHRLAVLTALRRSACREDDTFIDQLEAAGVAYVPFFPMGGGFPLCNLRRWIARQVRLSERPSQSPWRGYYSVPPISC
jgi:hypothetical protein